MSKILSFLFAFFGIGILLFSIFKTAKITTFCANSESCINDLSGQFDPTANLAEFMDQYINIPPMLADTNFDKNVLAEATGNPKRIEVDLTNQMLYAYENNQIVMSFPVSTGKWHYTPTGTFHTWIKLRYTRMSGGDPKLHTYYNLPNVPYTMYFYNDEHPKAQGYGLHGAYWHNSFGHPMSHGCVNISPENAGKLFNWAELGIEVVIYGSTPKS